tara:strand:+ start:477 stop:899 length:423 start_codon:yes stop_codon:yes gene_type:complete
MSGRENIIGEVINLFKRDEYYKSKPVSLLESAVFPALKNDKYVTYKLGSEIKGLCTYAFMTDKEISESKFDGDEVFSRDDGDVLHVCQFVCDGDRKDVFSFVRHIQKTLSTRYPNRPFATAIRKKSGSQRPAKYVKGLAQ